MALATINEAAYGRLLARALPRVIKTEAENERMIAELERLDTRGRPLTPEEENLAYITQQRRRPRKARYPRPSAHARGREPRRPHDAADTPVRGIEIPAQPCRAHRGPPC